MIDGSRVVTGPDTLTPMWGLDLAVSSPSQHAGFEVYRDRPDNARELFTAIGLEDELRREPDSREKIERRIENVREIVNALATYEGRDGQPTLSGFLEKVALLDRDAGEGREGRNAKCWNGSSCRP